jgi:predicted small lipoprotein YifL
MTTRSHPARLLAAIALVVAAGGCGQRGPLYMPPPPPGPIPDRVPDRPVAEPPPEASGSAPAGSRQTR